MKRTFGLVVNVVVACLALSGCSLRAQTLLKEWETAPPPAFVAENTQAKPHSDMPPAAEPGAIAPSLTLLQDEGGDQLAPPDLGHTFFTAEPERLKSLAPVVSDPVAAAALLADGFGLADFEILVLLRNPGLKAAEQTLLATAERYPQALALRDTLQQYAAFTQALAPGVGGMTGRAPLAAIQPYPGVTSLTGEIAHHEVLAARERLEAARRTTMTNARKAFWEFFFSHKANANAERAYAMADSLKNSSAAQYASGNADILALLRVDQEYGVMKERIPVQFEMLRARQTALLSFLDLPAGTRVGVPADKDADVSIPAAERLVGLALELRQELREMRAEIKRLERVIELGETELYPGFTLGFSLPARNEIAQAEGEGAGAEGASTPVTPFFGAENAYLREARRLLLSLQERLHQAEADTSLAVTEAWYRFDKARREEMLYRNKIVPLSRTEVETISSGYASGNRSFAEMIDSYSRLFAADLAWQRLRADLGITRAELEEAVGGHLPVGE